MNKCGNECISKGKCEHDKECYDGVYFTSEQSKAVEELIVKAKENERVKTIDEFLERVLADKCGILICPSSNIDCYACVARRVAKQMKEQMKGNKRCLNK